MPPTPGRLPQGLTAEVLDALIATANRGGIGVSIVAVDVDPPEYLFLNEPVPALLGYTPEEYAKVPVWQHFTPESLADMRERHRHRFETSGTTHRFEVWLRKKDGGRMPFDVTTSRLDVRGRPLNISFLHDVSERTRALEALAASEMRFRTAVESAPDGVVILRGPLIIYANRRAATLLGYDDPHLVVGRLVTEFLHPDDARLAASRIKELLGTQRRFERPAEYRSLRPDGSPAVVEISSVPIEFEGSPAVLAFARDVTERSALHSKMVQADRLAAVGTLAAGIAHEINNPLAYVLLGLQYLERELPKLASEPGRVREAIERLSEIRNGAERVGTIVRDLKTFARADEVARGPVDIQQVVLAAMKIADNEIRHRATLARDFQHVPRVDGNAARLEQVFLNLLVNAAHAVSERDPASSEVRVSTRCGTEGFVVVEVTDNGTGIPPELLGHVFDPFFTTKPVGVGTGLGLPICRSIVESFGGSIGLESQPGRTTARVTLPVYVHKGTTRPPRALTPVPAQIGNGRTRILIVDDEPLVTTLLRRMLGTENDVSVATSGTEALHALASRSFDAIVCDVMMPGMTGMDVYAALRQKGDLHADRMVFMTGGAFVPRVAEFLATVQNPKLEKPFDMDKLLRALRTVTATA